MPWRNGYRCRDGKWLMLSIVHNDGRWDVFRKAVQSPLLDDPRFQTTPGRKEHGVALTSLMDKVFAEKTLAEWSAILDEHGVVFGTVYTMADVPNDEQAKICGALVPTEDGTTLTVSSPFWIAGEDKIKPKRPPAIGQHNDEVLASTGLSADDIRKLRADGVVK